MVLWAVARCVVRRMIFLAHFAGRIGTISFFICDFSMAAFFSLIPAAGVGARMSADQPKQYLQVAGKPVLRHALDTFAAASVISHTFVVVTATDAMIDKLLAVTPALHEQVSIIRAGGSTRRETVCNGLQAMRDHVSDDDWILVHDAARPGLTPDLIDVLIAALRDDPVGGLLALPIVDTLKRAGPDGKVVCTVSREALWAAQTPQMFRYRLLCEALAQQASFTDESSAIEALGYQPKLVMGHARNFKITLPCDLALAEQYLQSDLADFSNAKPALPVSTNCDVMQ